MDFASFCKLDAEKRVSVMITHIKGEPGLRGLCEEARQAGELSKLENVWIALLGSDDPRLHSENFDQVLWSPDKAQVGERVNVRVDDSAFLETLLAVIAAECSAGSRVIPALQMGHARETRERLRSKYARALRMLGAAPAASPHPSPSPTKEPAPPGESAFRRIARAVVGLILLAGISVAAFRVIVEDGLHLPADQRTVYRLERKAAKGQIKAKFLLAKHYLLEQSPPDREKGMPLLEEAALRGPVSAKLLLARLLFEGDPSPADRARARQLLAFAIGRGSRAAVQLKSELIESGALGQMTDAEKLAAWEDLAKRGSHEAALAHAAMIEQGGGDRAPDLSRSAVLYWKIRGAEADAALARLWERRAELEVEPETLRSIANRLCQRKNAEACLQWVRDDYSPPSDSLGFSSRERVTGNWLRALGVAEEAGLPGVAWMRYRVKYEGTNEPGAIDALREVAEGGRAEAMMRLARAYEIGDGYLAWMKFGDYEAKAAAASSRSYSQDAKRLDGMAPYKVGVARDLAESYRWWLAAAEAGSGRAQLRVGDALRLGIGVAANPTEASTWYLRASESGEPAAAVGLAWLRFDEGDAGPALAMVASAADAGVARAKTAAGLMLEAASNRPTFERTLKYFRDASESGDRRASYLAGRILLATAKDTTGKALGAAMLETASKAEITDASVRLMRLYREIEGRETSRFTNHLFRAATRGHAPSLQRLFRPSSDHAAAAQALVDATPTRPPPSDVPGVPELVWKKLEQLSPPLTLE